MAIKKQTSGKPPRKSASAFHRRDFKNPVPAKRMTVGVKYEGWECKSDDCQRVIAITTTSSRGTKIILQDAVDSIASVKCPHCSAPQEHRWNARTDLLHRPKRS